MMTLEERSVRGFKQEVDQWVFLEVTLANADLTVKKPKSHLEDSLKQGASEARRPF